MARTHKKKGIQSRLIRVFAMQASLVSIATILGVSAAYTIVEDYLVHEALTGEAAHYWSLHDTHDGFPLPDTKNMKGYLAGEPGLPDALAHLPDDYFGRIELNDKHPLVLVSPHQDNTLYLVFKEEQVLNLALIFGVAPLTLVLILIYSASWFTFRQSQRLISPVTQLARIVRQTNVHADHALESRLAEFQDIDEDIDALASALSDFTQRIQLFVERERSFTRDASHELRTPLAVLKGSLDILQQQKNLPEQHLAVLRRMRITITGMEELIATLLFMAREQMPIQDGTEVMLEAVLKESIEQVSDALKDKQPEFDLHVQHTLAVKAPKQVVAILVTNLLRNAVQYGEGKCIRVDIKHRTLTIKDQGKGMNANELESAFRPFYRAQQDAQGYGLGLTIVKRLCDDYGWTLSAYSSQGKGTAISITFN